MSIASAVRRTSSLDASVGPVWREARESLGTRGLQVGALEAFRRHFAGEGQYKRPEDLYNRTATEFFVRYGPTNILKAFYVLCEFEQLGLSRQCRRVIDVGAGPGSATLAVLLCARRSEPGQWPLDRIDLVDASDASLKLSERVLDRFVSGTETAIGRRFLKSSDCAAVVEQSGPNDLILFGHSLLEILRDPRTDQRRLADVLALSEAPVVVLEHLGSGTDTRLLEGFLERLLPHRRRVRLYEWADTCDRGSNADFTSNHHRVFDVASLGSFDHRCWAGGRSGFPATSQLSVASTILIPRSWPLPVSSSPGAALMRKYKVAWERHDLSLLEDMFLGTSIYLEREGSVFCGLDDIRRYWAENAKRQRSVEFQVRFIADSRSEIEAWWSSAFERRDMDAEFILDGQLACDLHGGKITRFSESFTKVVHPLTLDRVTQCANVACAQQERSRSTDAGAGCVASSGRLVAVGGSRLSGSPVARSHQAAQREGATSNAVREQQISPDSGQRSWRWPAGLHKVSQGGDVEIERNGHATIEHVTENEIIHEDVRLRRASSLTAPCAIDTGPLRPVPGV